MSSETAVKSKKLMCVCVRCVMRAVVAREGWHPERFVETDNDFPTRRFVISSPTISLLPCYDCNPLILSSTVVEQRAAIAGALRERRKSLRDEFVSIAREGD